MRGVLLLIGTRKGAFLAESDLDRKDWTLRGPFCQGWPTYHAIWDDATGTIYVAAGSEWHGAAVWRSHDLGETWEWSGEGLAYSDDDGRKITKISGLTVTDGRILAGVSEPGIFESRDGGVTWRHFSSLEDQPARKTWMNPQASPPGQLGIPAILPDPDDPQTLLAVVQGFGMWKTTDDGKSWTPWNSGLRADWPLEDPAWGYCIHKPVRSPVDPQRLYAQTHVGAYRSDDGAETWQEITEGLPSDFGFACAAHPHDRDTWYTVPLDAMNGRVMHDGKTTVWRTRDAGSSWQPLRNGLPQEQSYLGALREGMATDTLDTAGIYFGTSTGQLFASADEGESWTQVADYLPGITSVEAAVVER